MAVTPFDPPYLKTPHTNPMAVCFMEEELWLIEVRKIYNFFCSCDLDLDPMTFIYKIEPYSPEIYRMRNEFPTSNLSKFIILQPTHGHFRSLDNDGVTPLVRHIRKPHGNNGTRKPHGSVCYRTGVMGDRSLHCGNRDFRCSRSLKSVPYQTKQAACHRGTAYNKT